jgi:hypothetical protein
MPYSTLNGIRIHYDSHGEGDEHGEDCNRAVLGFLRGVKR